LFFLKNKRDLQEASPQNILIKRRKYKGREGRGGKEPDPQNFSSFK
jgi:hypothetical protein